MAEALKATLYSPTQMRGPFEAAYNMAKALVMAGHRLTLEVKPETRNSEQNALLHATLSEIAKTREWAGAKRDAETWKRLMTAAWLRARGESVEILPAIDGFGVDVVFRRTSSLTKGECADLITFIQAWEATQ